MLLNLSKPGSISAKVSASSSAVILSLAASKSIFKVFSLAVSLKP
jgi:hypothetical protein